MAITVLHGCDQAGPTSHRPTNAPIGFMYFDTDLSMVLVWNGDHWQATTGTTTTTEEPTTTTSE